MSDREKILYQPDGDCFLAWFVMYRRMVLNAYTFYLPPIAIRHKKRWVHEMNTFDPILLCDFAAIFV